MIVYKPNHLLFIIRKKVGNTINKSGNAKHNPPITAIAKGW